MSNNVIAYGIVRPFARQSLPKTEEEREEGNFFSDKEGNWWWIETFEEDDADNSFVELEPFEGGYRFRTLYYDGGTSLEEVLQYALEEETYEW